MTTTKPVIPRIVVTARDPITGRSKSITLYETTPEEFIELITLGEGVMSFRRRANPASPRRVPQATR